MKRESLKRHLAVTMAAVMCAGWYQAAELVQNQRADTQVRLGHGVRAAAKQRTKSYELTVSGIGVLNYLPIYIAEQEGLV